MQVELLSPDGTTYSGNAKSVTLPSGDGEITVLENHIPLISSVKPGTVIVRTDDDELYFAVSHGVVQIEKHQIRILADTADRTDALEEAAIELAKKRAEELMHERRDDAEGFADASAMLAREIARLDTLRKFRSRTRRSL